MNNRKWHEQIENIDMTKNSKKTSDQMIQTSCVNVMENQVASEPFRNQKQNTKFKKKEDQVEQRYRML